METLVASDMPVLFFYLDLNSWLTYRMAVSAGGGSTMVGSELDLWLLSFYMSG